MTTMVRGMNWDTVAQQEGEAIIELSSKDSEDVSGGIPLPWLVGLGLLLWPTSAGGWW